jgi:hypothetical protein
MSVLSETFEIDYAAAITFTLTQPNCSVQRDEKHNRYQVKVYLKTRVFLT